MAKGKQQAPPPKPQPLPPPTRVHAPQWRVGYVHASDWEALDEAVNELCKQGWEPCGAPLIEVRPLKREFTQAVRIKV